LFGCELKENDILDTQEVLVVAQRKTAGPPRKAYQKPELVRLGTLLELTHGSVDGLNSDVDEFTGSFGV